ncbi:MAG: TVP38/TMEM64 family protein [Proteobacteria bacterium]|nr:TVP38/TMEM64 family protein [Pseudomonadota bacterium]
MKKPVLKLFVFGLILAFIALFFYLDLGSYLTLSYLKAKQADFQDFYQKNTLLTVLIYFAIYVFMAALSLPGAAVLTLAGGALLGFGTGLAVVSFASSIGASCAFLVSRFLLRDSIQAKFGDRLLTVNEGIEKEGAFYLFTLRLVPIFPFFVINLVMGLSPIRTWTFYWVSQLGMLPGTAVFINAGTQLAQIETLSGILSPKLIVSFALLGFFPILAKRVIGILKKGGSHGKH